MYDQAGGFFSRGGQAGRRGDFLTSPEVGPLFGMVVARALDAWWREQGTPDPWFVVDAGAGSGTLARSVLGAAPACAPALRYILVECSAPLRARHAEHLPLEPASWAFAALATDDEEPSATGIGPIAVSLAELPEIALQGVVIANELLDNLPFALAEWAGDAWSEVWVGADGGRLVETVVPARAAVVEVLGAVAIEPALGARVPVQRAARAWLAGALDRLVAGRVVMFDYASTTADLAGRPPADWLRTYRGHQRGGPVLVDPGTQDITVEVALDQLARVRAPAAITTQAEFLAAHGLAELVDEGRREWERQAGVGDLAAVRARSRVREAEALVDPAGLGGFTVAEWVVGHHRSDHLG